VRNKGFAIALGALPSLCTFMGHPSILSTKAPLSPPAVCSNSHIMSWPPLVCWRVYEELIFCVFQVGRLGDDGWCHI